MTPAAAALPQPNLQTRASLDPWIAAAIAFAILIRLFGLDQAALWHDEIETAIWARLSPGEALQTIVSRTAFGRYDPNHLPFYFVIVNSWAKIAGTSAWALRFPSVVFSVATVALIAALARTLVDMSAARWAAGLAAISPYLINHAQEARMYPLVSALSALSLLLLARFLTGYSRKLGAGFVLTNIALLATHYYTVFLIGPELLLLVIFRPGPSRNWVPGACASIVAVGLLTYVALVLTPHESGEIYQMGWTAFPGVVWSMLSGYTLLPSSEDLHRFGLRAILPYLPYALVAVAPAVILVVTGIKQMSARTRAIIAIVLGGTLLGPFMAYVVFAHISINPRYFMPGVPAFLVLLAAGAPRRIDSFLGTATAGVVVGVMLIGLTRHFYDPGQKREDVRAAGRWLDQNVSTNEEILVSSDEMATLAYYHWPHRRIRLYPARNVVATSANAEALAKEMPSSASGRVIYVFGRDWLSDPSGLLQESLKRMYSQCPGTEARGIHIYCFARP
jgi:4-amino-4-deoxy-L-arabinose transferase-like glycosyltransferase